MNTPCCASVLSSTHEYVYKPCDTSTTASSRLPKMIGIALVYIYMVHVCVPPQQDRTDGYNALSPSPFISPRPQPHSTQCASGDGGGEAGEVETCGDKIISAIPYTEQD